MAKNRKRNYGSARQTSTTLPRRIGFILAGIQGVVSVVFLILLLLLNMLPLRFVGMIGMLLAIAFLGVLLSQVLSKKKGLAGKIISIILIVVLSVGSYYIAGMRGMLSSITDGKSKKDVMVVAVLKEDAAQSITDAADYDFGVQYVLKGEQVKETVSQINKELGSDIATTQCDSVLEQGDMLMDKEVGAIIYNEAYASMLEENIKDYSKKIRIIYTYEINSELSDTSQNVSVSDCFAVYISGIDVYGDIETNSRSDVNIIAVVNPNTHQVLLVTTPRDYYVEFPGVTGGAKDKLTHAGIYGVDVSMATLEQLYDVDLDFYYRVNFTSLVTIVDALGGVDVESTQSFTTSEDSGYVFQVNEGTNHFNGTEALAFARERMNVSGGDFQRGKNQEALIVAMMKKATSPAILSGASSILASVGGNVDTNMSQSQIQKLVKNQISEGTAWDIKSMAAEGTGDNQYCYSSGDTLLYVTQPDQDSVNAIKAQIDALEAGQILEGTESTQ